ncbi:hypothetical protein M406DRAFT_67772 [Cryphonectria parasitica EP155]|uniref:Methyltransferase type 12 domain-containing protein n=1 Tax=Cryphonectria parasitica (strain ATCC 38755 / EP155) TaxID=660469 RepID=A0A9P4Y2A7_CRYP1|nr:uncharacterized protein M406DRAFT_67772 [Cryphonectria parasitica EP155]KAF3765316.1 hypothetical protein M406DRAFT_67772 [Cryphonectria parasitica EP155]
MAATLQWEPKLDGVPASELMKPSRDSTAEQQMMERMYIMCAVEMLGKLKAAQCTKPHFERYRTWLVEEYERYKQPGGVPVVADSAAIVAMSSDTRRKSIEECYEKSKGTHMWPVMEAAWRVYVNMIDIVEGRIKLLRVLMTDNLLPQFYDWTNELSDLRLLWRAFGISKPQLRVLEIGAGTGGTTARVLEGFKSESGEQLYGSYTFTDVSATFFDAARKRFGNHDNIEYRALDISRDPLQQGFEAGAYDLVIASNVLHATPCLVETLQNCRAMLQPEGYLFLQEMSPPGRYPDFVVGMFPGWWAGDPDGRPDGPTVKPKEWENRLQQAGFEGLYAVAYDNDPPLYYNANMLARPAASIE